MGYRIDDLERSLTDLVREANLPDASQSQGGALGGAVGGAAAGAGDVGAAGTVGASALVGDPTTDSIAGAGSSEVTDISEPAASAV